MEFREFIESDRVKFEAAAVAASFVLSFNFLNITTSEALLNKVLLALIFTKFFYRKLYFFTEGDNEINTKCKLEIVEIQVKCTNNPTGDPIFERAYDTRKTDKGAE